METIDHVDKSVYNRSTMDIRHDQDWNERPARERLLLTAHDLFYRDGIRATGIDKIIAAAGVTKVTFYRHFPSKDDLIRAFLEFRHQRWLAWFKDSLARHGGNVDALPLAMAEWFRDPGFRGCAFLNSVSELGGVLADVRTITRQHKDEVVSIIEALLPDSPDRHLRALAISIGLDGAIVRASFDSSNEDLELALRMIVGTLSND